MIRSPFRYLSGSVCRLMVLPVILLVVYGFVPARATPDFNRDIRPILSENCFHCHGPDDASRKADIRLDTEEGARAIGKNGAPVHPDPASPEAGLIWKRIHASDPDDVMPPPQSKRSLTSAQIVLLEEWLRDGAPYQSHWAFEAPVRPAVPAVPPEAAVVNPVDAFAWQQLNRLGLDFSPPAGPETMVRRLHLDLTGLPPTPDEVTEFVTGMNEETPGFYESWVDRLLRSTAFGEHWARPWLDLARYADSNGFQADQLRDSWAFRDWVIQAINQNMPFDQFTIEQLAGDLLPDPSIDQLVATGFHRTVTCNVEAGVHPEENRVNQVFDRVNTTATVWLGVTLECAQCHNHKYDPFSMKDYYSMFAFFNNTPLEVELPSSESDVQHNFIGPFIDLPLSDSLKNRRETISARIHSLQQLKAARGHDSIPETDHEIAGLEKELASIQPARTLVMQELPVQRDTRILRRGNYLDPQEKVKPATPSSLHPFPDPLPPNRLGLAQWLVSRDNPLVARVTVNRLWARLWGRGIVRTLEDFGTQSKPPTHPALLDWLAVEFMDSGWDRKSVIRTICLSRIYRQSSNLSPRLSMVDPDGRWLSRGARFRLDAETIRDNGLAVSGLLSRKMYGSPVMPHQPQGIWKAVGRNAPVWKEMDDPDRWRRGVYVVHRRAAPYPSMVNFDAPDRASCVVSRPRTNTPLQALTLMNDPAYVEMALSLADRVLTRCSTASFNDRVRFLYQVALARMPSPAETGFLRDVYDSWRGEPSSHTKRLQKLLENPGIVFRPVQQDSGELWAWFILSTMILNLDEIITRA